MSDEPSKVFWFKNDEPEMQQAYANARKTFRYFWRELSWEHRRIVPALDLACVKAPFADSDDEDAEVEHMWISEIDFDGRTVSGVLLNSPNELESVSEGDSVRIPLTDITDWMYAIDGEVFGAYTVNLMRSRMKPRERKEHDAAWGLDFGDPASIRIAPEPKKAGLLKSLFGGKPPADTDEHPMSAGMAEELKKQIAKDRSVVSAKDAKGWTLLHDEALAGNLATVQVLLDAGADKKAVAKNGMTPLKLAKSLGWDKVAALLK